MIMYRAFFNLIEQVDVERRTKSSVWINGKRKKINGECHSYFDTFQEAKDHMINLSLEKIQRLNKSLEIEESKLEEFKQLIKPNC